MVQRFSLLLYTYSFPSQADVRTGAGRIVQWTAEPRETIVTPPPKLVSLHDAYLLLVMLGLFGCHHFYLRRPTFGFVCLLFPNVIWWLIDMVRLPGLVREANTRIEREFEAARRGETTNEKEKLLLSDAYALWRFPFGIFGKTREINLTVLLQSKYILGLKRLMSNLPDWFEWLKSKKLLFWSIEKVISSTYRRSAAVNWVRESAGKCTPTAIQRQ